MRTQPSIKPLGGEREFQDLSFNLLVAGELEIISSKYVSKKERNTRLEVLKKLTYKHEVLPIGDILAQYASFVSKVEKGKFKWGSKSALSAFDQQLMSVALIRTSAEPTSGGAIFRGRECEQGRGKTKVMNGKDEKKKYCLEFNKGTCSLQGPHEGTLNGLTVMKYHICKRCLIEDRLECSHPSKDCVRK